MNREQRLAARRNAADSRIKDFLDAFEEAADRLSIPCSERRRFLGWTIENLWNKHIEERMNRRLVIENEINNLGLRIPNGTVRKAYTASFALPADKVKDVAIDGLEETGLTLSQPAEGEYLISGTPQKHGDLTLTVSYSTVEGEPRSSFKLPVAFNPDPRSIWRDLRSRLHKDGVKPDWATEYIMVKEDAEGATRKDVIAASIQGRSHAHEERPRDDYFAARHYEDSDWYVVAVADGAGSAPLSWKGSEIACDTIIEHCRENLDGNKVFEEAIAAFHADPNTELRSVLTAQVSNIIYKGAVKAHEAINAEAAAQGEKPRDYATTLMFAICKHFSFGWFIASFWVGDGAMCIYDEKGGSAKLLGTPDEGEFSGQTRFITMREIFHDKDLVAKRMRMTIVPDFTALFLMTDGVSDPLFETDNNLNDFNKWKEFYSLLKEGFPEDGIRGVNLTDDNPEAAGELLEWLKFWRPGNHDDRTMVVVK
ncbi:MAG: protein phosphatase 2C domain-containing protein [Muribaculaceae bacterium]|nr:protein phosphatase 2C domain-containing protein [Muribaculaceae bacterium]